MILRELIMKKYLNKERKWLDADTSIGEVFQHCLVNFLYGLTSGLAIAAVSKDNPYLIAVSYYALKQVESKVLNRNKYTTRLGKNIIYPFPSMFGFLLGWKISTML